MIPDEGYWTTNEEHSQDNADEEGAVETMDHIASYAERWCLKNTDVKSEDRSADEEDRHCPDDLPYERRIDVGYRSSA